VLIKRDILERIAAGEIDRVYRRWRKPTVKSGGTLKTAVGLLAIESVEAIAIAKLRAADAARAGYPSLAELKRQLASRDGAAKETRIYRIAVRLAGPDPRIALRRERVAGEAEAAEIAARLERLDRASARGPWTARTLLLIGNNPGVRAADLAEGEGLTKKIFKPRVRRLKGLGLTESLETGYRLSPRGESLLPYLDAV
jgi:hypothetical protein